MERVVLRHLSGAKGQQVESIPLDKARDLLIGREPSAHIRFDPESDDLVGRQHARILQDPGDRYKFSIVDLNSRNGTYVNKQRVVGTAAITTGDIIQLGPGGPEFQFDLDPLPAHLVKSTRQAATPQGAMAATRVASSPTSAIGAPGKSSVGKETVERMVTTAKKEGRRNLALGVAASLLVVGGIVAALAWRADRRAAILEATAGRLSAESADKPFTAKQIADSYTSSTVLIEFKWKLVNAGTGEQIYHEYFQPTDKTGRPAKDNDGNAIAALPVFWQVGNQYAAGADAAARQLRAEPADRRRQRRLGLRGDDRRVHPHQPPRRRKLGGALPGLPAPGRGAAGHAGPEGARRSWTSASSGSPAGCRSPAASSRAAAWSIAGRPSTRASRARTSTSTSPSR